MRLKSQQPPDQREACFPEPNLPMASAIQRATPFAEVMGGMRLEHQPARVIR